MTREEAKAWFKVLLKDEYAFNSADREAFALAIKALEQEPCPDAISRQATLEPYKILNDTDTLCVALIRANIMQQPPVNPQPKTGYISIDDVMSVFDDFMRGEADEDGTDTFLKMLKDRAESEGEQDV